MGVVQLELRCPQTANGIVVDPKPDWSFEALLSEINSLELKFNASLPGPTPFAKTRPREFLSTREAIDTKRRNAFVMHVSEDESEDVGSDGEGSYDQRMVVGKRFAFDELSSSDSDDPENESAMETQDYLMDKVEEVEVGLAELTHEHQVGVMEKIRNRLSALETDLIKDCEKSSFSLGRVEKYTQSRREMDRRIDTQYQRRIAEALDSYLTAVQRDHEHWSQIEERKIRDAAAVEEAKRKERAIQEEKQIEESKIRDAAAVEEAKRKERAIQEEKIRDAAAVEDAKRKERAIQEEKIRDAAAVEEAKRKERAIHEEKIRDAAAVEETKGKERAIQEEKMRDAAAVEEAKRKENAFQEEKIRQEKSKAEAEAHAKKKAEDARIAALEADKKAAKEAAENSAKVATEKIHATASGNVQVHKKTESSLGSSIVELNRSASKGPASLHSTGNIIRSTESALKLEEVRLKKYEEVDKNNQALRSGCNMDFRSYERKVSRQIKQTSGTKEAVRAKATELINIFMDVSCPQSITIALFAAKVISLCENPGSAPFALGHVIVLVTSKFPLAMDLILAEFHRACIYTVPKHIGYSESVFGTKEAYKRAIGFREEDGKLESIRKYLERVEAHMRLFGAMVQTEIDGVQNIHGLKEGWAWLANLLNALPANICSAMALEAFLKMAGFALFKRYKSQFRKILKVISRDFVSALKARNDSGLELVIRRIESYIETNQFMQEPEGWRLPSSTLSSSLVPPPGDQHYYSYAPNYYNSRKSSSPNTYRR